MTRYAGIVTQAVPQTEQAHPLQAMNNAGGFSFKIDKWSRLDRFLVLGSEGGTYYVSEKKLTKDNAKSIEECIAEDGVRTVKRIVDISEAGRAPKNDPAIFALALCASAKDPATRAAALEALPKVCRIGTHLFHFAHDVNALRKWSRALRTAVSNWYLVRSDVSLATQLVKYQSRDGWSHKDVLRLAHPIATTNAKNAALRWATGGAEALDKELARGKNSTKKYQSAVSDALPQLIVGFEKAKKATSAKEIVQLIEQYKLPREALPTQWLNEPSVWEALIPEMGATALVRNLAKMTAVGLLSPLGDATDRVARKLTDVEQLKAGRVHPLAVLLASGVYRQGHGNKGKLSWVPVSRIIDALDEAFYGAFNAVTPAGKKHLLALDISGSMGSPIGDTGISAREGSAAMALVTAKTEPQFHVVGFSHTLIPLDISPRQRLTDAVRSIANLPFGSTDCGLPMLYAREKRLDVDTFVVYTDNETFAGHVHPHIALEQYRKAMGKPDAKLIVVGMCSNDFSIANPNDPGMLDVVGFDAAAPAVMADFARGSLTS